MIVNAGTSSFNPTTNVGYTKPRINASGGKSVNIVNPATQQVLNLSTPLVLTWGAQEFVDENTGKRTYDMALQFPKEEYATSATRQFLQNMQAMEEKLKADAVANSKEWFNKQKMSPEVVDALFHPMLRYPRDPGTGEPDTSRPPTLKVKLNYWDGSFDNTEIYDMDQKLLFGNGLQEPGRGPLELIPKATNVAVVMRCGGLWFANGKFGCTWRLVQAVVKPRPTLAGKCHIQLGDDERQVLSAQEDDDSPPVHSTAVVDSDDEADASESPVAAPVAAEPPAAPVKKVVKRKVVRRGKAAEAE
jgi:hypothetical protein